MRCNLQPELAAKCSLKSSLYTLIVPHKIIQLTTIVILGLRDKAAPPTSQQIREFPQNRVKYQHHHLFKKKKKKKSSLSTGEISLLSTNQRQGSPIWANISRKCWPQFVEYPELGSRSKRWPSQLRTNYVHRIFISCTSFAKQKLAQLRTGFT